MSNMNMKIIINKNSKIKKTKDCLLLDESNLNKYILPSFTKKYLTLHHIKMKNIAIIGAGISGLYLANLLEKNSSFSYKIFEKTIIRFK